MTLKYPANIAEVSTPRRRPGEAAAVLALLVIAIVFRGGLRAVADPALWALLLLVPGWAVYRAFAGPQPRLVEASVAATVLSPVLLAVASIAGLFAHIAPARIGVGFAVAAALGGVAVSLRPTRPAPRPSRCELMALAGLLLLIGFFVAYLPMTRAWWRMRDDAWFHDAVVSQIAAYGVPPSDPYFVGLPLQYMWFYHSMILVLARTLAVDPFRAMALVNIQALAALTLAAYQLSAVFRERTAHRITATAMLLLGFNAAFWVFFPVKLLKALIGNVRGVPEIIRTFTLSPYNYDTACHFLGTYFNQEFFLDKYMVATAFGLALAFMTAAWASTAAYLRDRRRVHLAMLAVALIGLLGFHSFVGFVMLVAIFGGGILSHLVRHRIDGYRGRDVLILLGVSLGCFLVMTPYLYDVMHLKEHEQVFPLSIEFAKTAGIFISCALVTVMAWRARSFWSARQFAVRYYVLAAFSLIVFCLLIKLPGPNTYDKLGYLVFLPLAIPAGFAVADSILSRAGGRRVAVASAWIVLFFLPVNVIAISSCFTTPSETLVTPAEARLSAWVRDHTSRGAVMIDENDRVALLVTGPRRYLCGRWAYAQQWGYPRLEMARRMHARDALYADAPLDRTVLDVLSGVSAPLYVIVRPDERARDAAVIHHPELFTKVYSGAELALYRVDGAACAAAAPDAPPGPSPEELVRESRL